MPVSRSRLPLAVLACLGLGLALVPATPAAAEQSKPAPASQQVPLTEDLVKRFLASYPELKALGKKLGDEAPEPGAAKGPFAGISAYMRSHQTQSAFQTILDRHGFPDVSAWSAVAQSVALAYGYAKSGRTPADVSAQSERVLAQIRDNPSFSPEQKQQMMAMLKQQMGALGRYQPPPGNIALVRKMLPEISAVMDSE